MDFKSMKIRIFVYGALLFLLFPRQAHAYLDPGTGSYFFQMLIAGLLGSLFFVKSIIKGVKEFFKSISKKRTSSRESNED